MQSGFGFLDYSHRLRPPRIAHTRAQPKGNRPLFAHTAGYLLGGHYPLIHASFIFIDTLVGQSDSHTCSTRGEIRDTAEMTVSQWLIGAIGRFVAPHETHKFPCLSNNSPTRRKANSSSQSNVMENMTLLLKGINPARRRDGNVLMKRH